MLSILRKHDPDGRVRVFTYYVQVHMYDLDEAENRMKTQAQAGRGQYQRIKRP